MSFCLARSGVASGRQESMAWSEAREVYRKRLYVQGQEKGVDPEGRAEARSADSMNGLVGQPHGRNIFVFKSLIGLKCFALLVHRIKPCSAVVAAIIASPVLNPCDRPYSST